MVSVVGRAVFKKLWSCADCSLRFMVLLVNRRKVFFWVLVKNVVAR